MVTSKPDKLLRETIESLGVFLRVNYVNHRLTKNRSLLSLSGQTGEVNPSIKGCSGVPVKALAVALESRSVLASLGRCHDWQMFFIYW